MPNMAKDIFLYYALAMVVGVAYFLWRRPRKGMRLRLRGGRSRANAALSGVEHPPPRPEKIAGRAGRNPQPQGKSSSKERSLNVVFNYNGHSWDAFEVLGLPAGSSP